jgi:hypothetical protein
MATNTLLQRLDFQADTTGSSVAASDRRQTERFRLKIPAGGGTITHTAGDWMQFDTGESGPDMTLTVAADINTFTLGNPLIAGVLLADVSEVQTASIRYVEVDLVVAGYAAVASVANAVAAAGVALVVDNTAAGQAVAIAAADTASACGVSLGAAGGNLAEVWVYKQF